MSQGANPTAGSTTDRASAPVAAPPAHLAGPQTLLRVAGMDCADEVEVVNRALKPLPGVRDVRVNLMAGTVTVAHTAEFSPESLVAALGRNGLRGTLATAKAGGESSADRQRGRLISVVVSGIFTGLGLLLAYTPAGAVLGERGFPIPQTILFGVAIIAGGWFIAPKALGALRRRSLDMNVLMTVAVAGAMAIGEWSEGAAGTDTAIETADVALMQDDLSQVAGAVQLGRRAMRVIQANIIFALAVKAVFLVLALLSYTSLWLAILADTGATLVVIANALRLLKVPEAPVTAT